jgi:hypothetical protein
LSGNKTFLYFGMLDVTLGDEYEADCHCQGVSRGFKFRSHRFASYLSLSLLLT